MVFDCCYCFVVVLGRSRSHSDRHAKPHFLLHCTSTTAANFCQKQHCSTNAQTQTQPNTPAHTHRNKTQRKQLPPPADAVPAGKKFGGLLLFLFVSSELFCSFLLFVLFFRCERGCQGQLRPRRDRQGQFCNRVVGFLSFVSFFVDPFCCFVVGLLARFRSGARTLVTICELSSRI